MRLRTIAANLLLLAGSGLLCLLVLEVGIRSYYGGNPAFISPQARHIPAAYGHKLAQRQSGTFTLDKPVTSNSHGFRDSEWAVPKPPATRRVLVVGDSLTFGNGVEGSQTFPEQLERRLRAGGEDVEVLNAGIQGWNLVNEAAFLRDEAWTYEPDVVILAFYPNDWISPNDPAASPVSLELSAEGRVESRPVWLRWLPYDAIFLMKRSAAVAFLRDRIGLMTQGRDFVAELIQSQVDLDASPVVKRTYEELLTLKRISDERDVPFVVASIPPVSLFWVPRDTVAYVSHLREFCRRNGIVFVDLSQGLWRAQGPTPLYMYPWDNHLSPEGHRVVAEQLIPVVEQALDAGGRSE